MPVLEVGLCEKVVLNISGRVWCMIHLLVQCAVAFSDIWKMLQTEHQNVAKGTYECG